MRVAFAGTPEFAVPALRALAESHDLVVVLSQPDRPAGRGLKVTPSAVSTAAETLQLRVEKLPSLRTAGAQTLIRDVRADVMVVAAYGLILPSEVLAIPGRGCLNIHASLLPRWRGAAPVHRAILAGDSSTGVCIMQMEQGLDTGPVLLRRTTEIRSDDTTGTLTQRLAVMGAEAIVEALGNLESLVPRPQDPEGVVYAAKVTKAETRIDWSRSAVEIDRQIRAFNPAPGAEALVAGELLKIWKATPVAGSGEPGSILPGPDDLRIACGEGALRVIELQRPGGRRLAATALRQGRPLGAARPA